MLNFHVECIILGTWPPLADAINVITVDRSPNQEYIVSGEDGGLVKLFRYPCCKEQSDFRAFKGHSAQVMSVRFSSDGKYVFSVGGLDKTIIQFEVKKEIGGQIKSKK